MLRAFARMARASGLTREEAEARLRGYYDTETQLQTELDKAYSQDVDTLQRYFLTAYGEAEPTLDKGQGQHVDDRGLDDADRAALAVIRVMDEEDL